ANIFDECPATGPALDVNGVGPGMREFAILNPHVTDATGRFAADANAGKNAVRELAMAYQHILGRAGKAVAFHATAGFEGDAIVAGGDVAIFNANVPARIHINTVTVAAGAADDK